MNTDVQRSVARPSPLAKLAAKAREIVSNRGVLWLLRRAAFHAWQLATQRRRAKYSWQLLTGTLPELDLVNVEVTTYCNLRCAGCQRTIQSAENRWNNRHLAVEDFRRLVEQLPTAAEFIPQGIGEPALHPALPALISIARDSQKFNQITLTSHAQVRDLDYFRQLFTSGLDILHISVDALDPVLASRLRAGTEVAVLTERIRVLAKEYPTQIVIRTTIGRENVGHFPEMLAVLNRLGRMEVVAHPYDDLGNPAGCLAPEDRRSFCERLPQWELQFENLRLRANGFWASSEVCSWPWRSPSIKVDGELTPCCRIMYHHDFSFGNVLRTAFAEIWNSPQTQAWRAGFLVRSPAICEGCPWFQWRPEPSAVLTQDRDCVASG
jgi:radical SAM protein with 4Fe4S-binding SPASM domain